MTLILILIFSFFFCESGKRFSFIFLISDVVCSLQFDQDPCAFLSCRWCRLLNYCQKRQEVFEIFKSPIVSDYHAALQAAAHTARKIVTASRQYPGIFPSGQQHHCFQVLVVATIKVSLFFSKFLYQYYIQFITFQIAISHFLNRLFKSSWEFPSHIGNQLFFKTRTSFLNYLLEG